MEQFKDIEAFYAKDRKSWRKWLEKNHDKKERVWLIQYKKDSKNISVKYDEAVEEGLCFGWIDSVKYKRDDESTYQYFAKRKLNSRWSKSNRDRVEKLQQEGLMMPPGQVLIDHAQKTGTWTGMVEIEKGIIPDDLQTLFNKNKKALINFQTFPPSSRQMILVWIKEAKRPETRQKRIAETVKLAAKNIRAR